MTCQWIFHGINLVSCLYVYQNFVRFDDDIVGVTMLPKIWDFDKKQKIINNWCWEPMP